MAPPSPQRATDSQLLRTGPPASIASVLNAFGFRLGTLPLATPALTTGSHYRRSPSHVPCKSRRPGSRRLYAGHRLANTRAHRQTHPGEKHRPPGFDVSSEILRRLNSDTPPGITPPGRALLERLPDPHLTRSSRAFPLSLSTTVFSQRTRGRFDAYPRRSTPEGQQASISRTASPLKMSPT